MEDKLKEVILFWLMVLLPLFLLGIQWGIARYKFTRDSRFYAYLVRCEHNKNEKWWTGMWELTFWRKTVKLVKAEAAKDGIEIFT